MRILVCPLLVLLSLGTAAAAAPKGDGPSVDDMGVTVVSSAATAPAGANQAFAPAPGAQIVIDPAKQAAVFTPVPATQAYTPCSKTVTDGCVQTYRGWQGTTK